VQETDGSLYVLRGYVNARKGASLVLRTRFNGDNYVCDFRGDLLSVRINLSHLEPGRAEAFWSESSAWLIDRGLYPGGDASTAVVYAPRRSSGPPARIWQTLRRKLEASQGRPFASRRRFWLASMLRLPLTWPRWRRCAMPSLR